MRKKITLVLTTIFLAIFLTACSTVITAEEYNELYSIASEIKNTDADYQPPEGYKVSYSNQKNSNQITITTTTKPTTGDGDNIKATFDITKNEPQLVSIEQEFDNCSSSIILATVWITAIVCLFLLNIFI